MIVVRSWPKEPPPFRACVDDDYTRVLITDFDHSALASLGDDVLLLEWDIAVSPEDVAKFSRFCLHDPNRIAAAPYRLYPCSTGLTNSVWSHRLVVSDNPWMIRHGIGERFADIVSLGMTYLPRELIRGYVRDNPHRAMTDTNFGMWHYQTHGRKIPIDWRIRPVHLHYT